MRYECDAPVLYALPCEGRPIFKRGILGHVIDSAGVLPSVDERRYAEGKHPRHRKCRQEAKKGTRWLHRSRG